MQMSPNAILAKCHTQKEAAIAEPRGIKTLFCHCRPSPTPPKSLRFHMSLFSFPGWTLFYQSRLIRCKEQLQDFSRLPRRPEPPVCPGNAVGRFSPTGRWRKPEKLFTRVFCSWNCWISVTLHKAGKESSLSLPNKTLKHTRGLSHPRRPMFSQAFYLL